MIEFRASILSHEAPEVLPVVACVAQKVEPQAALHAESLDSIELVSILFLRSESAEQFLMELGEIGIEFDNWILLPQYSENPNDQLELPF
jgi:hypothetical protein